MKLKPIKWVSTYFCGDFHYTAVVMGITIAAVPDKDGTYNATLSGIPGRRPEIQKNFKNADDAKHYAETVLLIREIKKYFME